MILQRDLSGEKLAEEISRFVESPEIITEMERAAKAMGREDAAEKTADLIEELKRNV
jgi:UDP-N-acetylglucosamine:LPS N-acetylglucosamine transferase